MSVTGSAPDPPRQIIWARAERATKGPAPSLTRRQVADAAVRLADTGGIEAVSMRRVAAELEVGTASLYRYVDSKDELYDLMVDTVEGEDGPPPVLHGAWRRDVIAYARRTRALMHRHPWLVSLAARPSFGPNSLAWTEHGLAAMDDLHLGADDSFLAAETIISFIRGFVSRELADRQALSRAGVDARDWAETITPYIQDVVASGRYPRFARVVTDARLPHEDTREAIFGNALDRILDGVHAREGRSPKRGAGARDQQPARRPPA
jgi:AcrR family transcriptional regulator